MGKTSQLKQLLGVQSPGRPTQQRQLSNSNNNAPWSSNNNARTPQQQQDSRYKQNYQAQHPQSNAAQTFWGNAGSGNSANTGANNANEVNDALGSGAELNAEMRQWASGEMQKIKGNSDLTLVSFCMTLSSNSEIREYMRDVLGSTPQVSSFASEFIRRKNKGGKKKRSKKR